MSDLTQARQDAQSYLLPDSCTIVNVVQGVDLGGAETETETQITSACAFDRISGREASADLLVERGAYRLKLPRNATISGTSRVIYGGKTYRVVWTPPLAQIGLTRLVGLAEA